MNSTNIYSNWGRYQILGYFARLYWTTLIRLPLQSSRMTSYSISRVKWKPWIFPMSSLIGRLSTKWEYINSKYLIHSRVSERKIIINNIIVASFTMRAIKHSI